MLIVIGFVFVKIVLRMKFIESVIVGMIVVVMSVMVIVVKVINLMVRCSMLLVI